MKNIKRIVTVVVLLLSLLPAYSQEETDSVYEFRFKPRNDMFFGVFRSNEMQLKELTAFVNRHRSAIDQGVMPLHVDGYCNSRGGEAKNRATARTRSNRVKSELITRLGLKESNFITHNHAQDGDYVNVRIVCAQNASEAAADTKHADVAAPATQAERAVQAETAVPVETPATASTEACSDEGVSHLSLRANLLRWATLTPDLGIEWQFARQWSIVVDGSWTSWSWDSKNRRYALWEVSPEVRYYFTPTNKFYLGAQYKIGHFNYKLSSTGKQGDLQGGGFTVGYKLPLGKRFALDFNAAAGCLHTDYETYQVIDDVRVKDDDRTKNAWGVTDLGVTLVWKLN